MDFFEKWPIKTISSKDKKFPRQLFDLKKRMPMKLFYRGNWEEDLFEKCLAIVGSRRMSRYGRTTLTKLMPEIIANQFTIVSGFMYGVDSLAHKECINLGGKTIAVLGFGLNRIFPPENKYLYEEILKKGGVVISEYEPEIKPTAWTFPQRNRIVAALANKGVLVVEAGIKSGSLITARLGRELDREVLAIPGNVDLKLSEGTNYLIKNKMARMVTSAEDITFKNSIKQGSLFEVSLSPDEKNIVSVLKTEPMSADDLSIKTEIELPHILTILTGLSMKNMIEEENGMYYCL